MPTLEDDLELATNKQLILELFRRESFRGMIFCQRDFKDRHEKPWIWLVKGLPDRAEALTILGQIADLVRQCEDYGQTSPEQAKDIIGE
jgi:hypothetical protein